MDDQLQAAGSLPAEPVLPTKPGPHLTVQYDGQRRELFMSFQRLNALLRDIEDPRQILNIMVDPDLGEATLRVMLAESPEAIFEFVLRESAISNEDAEAILNWAADHLTYFFMKRFQQLGQRAAHLEPLAMALQSSQPGSAPSTSPAAAAGPSE